MRGMTSPCHGRGPWSCLGHLARTSLGFLDSGWHAVSDGTGGSGGGVGGMRSVWLWWPFRLCRTRRDWRPSTLSRPRFHIQHWFAIANFRHSFSSSLIHNIPRNKHRYGEVFGLPFVFVFLEGEKGRVFQLPVLGFLDLNYQEGQDRAGHDMTGTRARDMDIIKIYTPFLLFGLFLSGIIFILNRGVCCLLGFVFPFSVWLFLSLVGYPLASAASGLRICTRNIIITHYFTHIHDDWMKTACLGWLRLWPRWWRWEKPGGVMGGDWWFVWFV